MSNGNPYEEFFPDREGLKGQPKKVVPQRPDQKPYVDQTGVPPRPDFDKIVMPTDEELAEAQARITEEERSRRYDTGRVGFGKNIGSRGSRSEIPPVTYQKRQRPTGERREQQPDETVRLREQLTNAEDAYARVYAVAKSRMGLIRRTLGIENIENDPEVRQARETYVAAREAFNNLNVSRLQERLRSGQINEAQFNQEAQNLLVDVFVNHDLSLQNKKLQFRQAEDLRRGTLAGKVEAWWNRAVDGYRKLPLWAKVGTSLGLFALGGGAVAISGMVAMRIAGGAASAKGTQELLQSIADRWRKRTGGLKAGQRILGLERTNLDYRVSALQDLIKNYHGDMNQRFVKMERGDIVRRHIGIITGMIVGTGTLSGYIRDTIGDWWTGGKGGAVAPEGPGRAAVSEAPPSRVASGGPPVAEGGVKPPMFQEMASMKIPEGGSLWRGIEQSIRANPAAYGLDPNDPGFTRGVRKMTKQMLDEFASRKGLTYEQLDQIARLKVQPGDGLKIIYNPALEEIHIEYEGKAFGPDIGDNYGLNKEGYSPDEWQRRYGPLNKEGYSPDEWGLNKENYPSSYSVESGLTDPSATIVKGSNIWRTVRELYMQQPGRFGYDPNDSRIEKLFQSFRRQGILERLEINADSFADLSEDEKIKIWVENRTANSIRELTADQGGRIQDLVHPGDRIVLEPSGKIKFSPDSGLKPGYLPRRI